MATKTHDWLRCRKCTWVWSAMLEDLDNASLERRDRLIAIYTAHGERCSWCGKTWERERAKRGI